MKHYDYSMFKDFIEKYQTDGFGNINRADPFILDLEKKLDHNKQFLYVLDLIRLNVLFMTKGIKNAFGIGADEFDLAFFFGKIHQDDLLKYSLARAKCFKLGHDLFLKERGTTVASANFRELSISEKYINVLVQGYLFYSEIPVKTVYALILVTDITNIVKDKYSNHFYIGHDLANFRYPDAKLLELGQVFSRRELDILRLLAKGMDSEKIAEKLFLSVNTVNTHRRNLLRKTNKTTTHELVLELKESGML